MKLYLLAVITAAVASCAPNASPVTAVPTAPAITAAVSPSVELARQAQASASIVSDRLETQVAILKGATTEIRDGMANAVAEADRLRKQKSATEAELEGLWKSLTELNTRNLFLEAEAEKAVTLADEQRVLRMKAETGMINLTQVAADRDAETIALRSQHADMSATIATMQGVIDKQSSDLTKARESAAVGGYLRTWVAILAAALILISAAFVYLKFFSPPFLR